MFMMIGDSTELIMLATNNFLRQLAPKFYIPDDIPSALGPFMMGRVTLQFPP